MSVYTVPIKILYSLLNMPAVYYIQPFCAQTDSLNMHVARMMKTFGWNHMKTFNLFVLVDLILYMGLTKIDLELTCIMLMH